eukprot:TRINITY_DN15191_c0_g1_i1.p1 TRINITY_DN15191_c0_g1~~TRINITY_DN15191_c0_g1_i1.p1  ORF type:complete len:511 (-),score=40.48 TRINITY_DN15191_c0_g1_i1:215-1747(-)
MEISKSLYLSKWSIYAAATVGAVTAGIMTTSVGRRLVSTWLGFRDIPMPLGAKRIRSVYGVEEYNVRAYELDIWQSRIGIVISIEGPGTPAQIQTALMRLQRRHPLWNCGLHKRRNTWYFHEFEDSASRVNIETRPWTGPDTLDDFWSENLNKRVKMSPHDLLWSASIIQESDRMNHVAVFQYHCIGDGASLMHLVGDLLRELNDVVNGEPEPPRAEQIRRESFYHQVSSLSSWSSSIPFWRRFLPRLFSAVWSMTHFSGISHLPLRKGCSPRLRTTRAVNVSLPASDLDQFRQACKQHHVTVTAAIMACFVEAAKSVIGLEDDQLLSMHVPISLRDRLNPPVDRGEYVEAISVTRVDVPIMDNIWDCATYISENLLTAEAIQRHIAEGEFAIEGFNAAFRVEGEKIAAMANSNPYQCAPAVVSCLGVFQAPQYPVEIGNFRVVDLNLGQTLGAFGAHPALACMTYGGKFYLNLSFSEPLMMENEAVSLLEVILRFMRERSSENSAMIPV